jgi:hypothetical protein
MRPKTRTAQRTYHHSRRAAMKPLRGTGDNSAMAIAGGGD